MIPVKKRETEKKHIKDWMGGQKCPVYWSHFNSMAVDAPSLKRHTFPGKVQIPAMISTKNMR